MPPQSPQPPPLPLLDSDDREAAREQQQQQQGTALAGELLRRELGCGWDRWVCS